MCLRLPKRNGNHLAQATSEEEKKNAEIDRMIRRDRKQQSKNVKILLLGMMTATPTKRLITIYAPALKLTYFSSGAGESGKSTILKQMRLIHTDGFPMHERKEVRQVIFSNMVVAFKIIAEEMRDLGLRYENPETEVGQHQGSAIFGYH